MSDDNASDTTIVDATFLDDPITGRRAVPGMSDLADLASRPEHRGHLRLLGAVLVATALVVVAFNAVADPLGVVGDDRYRVVSRDWLDRTYKLEMLDERQSAPDLVVLGTSSSQRLAPAALGADVDGLNLALPASSPREVELLLQRMRRSWSEDPFPHVVWGLDVHSVRESPVNPALRSDPAIRDLLPVHEQVDVVLERWRPLFDVRRVPDGVRALRRGPASTPERAELFAPDGTALDPTIVEFDPGVRGDVRRLGAAELPSIDAFDELDADQVASIEAVVAFANEQGDRPLVFLPPVRPTRLDPDAQTGPDVADEQFWMDWRERRVELLELLRELGTRHELTVVDLSDLRAHGGSVDAYFDDVHPDDESIRIVVEQLVQRDAVQ